MRLYAIKDEVVGFNGSIMVMQNDEQMIRAMSAAVNAGDGNQMSMWAKDFSAWEVGDIDKVTGHIEPREPRLVCRGNSLKREGVEYEIRDGVRSKG